MPRICFTRVGEAWCVVPKSPRESREPLRGESVRAWLATVVIERCGRCVASQSALGWGDSLLSVAGHCPGESVRAWLARLSILSVAGRCPGESVRAWLGRLSLLSVAAAVWRVSPHLVGETVVIERCGCCVASQSALGWRLSLLSVATAAWRVSPRLVGETRY
ncbi:hypothetical protein ACLB2K_013219 [Fragaria x ananassa]